MKALHKTVGGASRGGCRESGPQVRCAQKWRQERRAGWASTGDRRCQGTAAPDLVFKHHTAADQQRQAAHHPERCCQLGAWACCAGLVISAAVAGADRAGTNQLAAAAAPAAVAGGAAGRQAPESAIQLHLSRAESLSPPKCWQSTSTHLAVSASVSCCACSARSFGQCCRRGKAVERAPRRNPGRALRPATCCRPKTCAVHRPGALQASIVLEKRLQEWKQRDGDTRRWARRGRQGTCAPHRRRLSLSAATKHLLHSRPSSLCRGLCLTVPFMIQK